MSVPRYPRDKAQVSQAMKKRIQMIQPIVNRSRCQILQSYAEVGSVIRLSIQGRVGDGAEP